MDEKTFDRVYNKRGGMKKLNAMIRDGLSQETIAKYFGVTRWAVSLWIRELFPGFNTLEERRKKKIKSLVAVLSIMPKKDFRKNYKYANQTYVEKAIEEFNKNCIK